MDKPIGTLRENLREHPAVRAWGRLKPERLEPESIVVIKRWKKNPLFGSYKSGVYLLAGVGRDGSGVIAKRCPPHTAAVERLIYEEFLPQVPLPTLGYYGSVEEGDGQSWWLFIEEATGELYSPNNPEHRALAGRWLAAVHRAGCDPRWKQGLPDRGPEQYLQLLRTCRAKLREHFTNPHLPLEGPTVLPALVRQCDVIEAHWTELEALCQIAPKTVVHCDFAIKNLRVRPAAHGPELLVFDWEYAGWGVPNIDLAQYIGGVASPDLAVYRSALECWTAVREEAQVRRLADCGGFFRLMGNMHWASLGLALAETIYLAEPVSELRSYSRRMAQVLEEIGWTTSN
jgi:hypothetical protein